MYDRLYCCLFQALAIGYNILVGTTKSGAISPKRLTTGRLYHLGYALHQLWASGTLFAESVKITFYQGFQSSATVFDTYLSLKFLNSSNCYKYFLLYLNAIIITAYFNLGM